MIMIGLAHRIEPGVKGIGSLAAVTDDDVVSQHAVQALLENFRGQSGVAAETGHLSQGMNPGIRPSGGGDTNRPADHGPKGRLDLSLEGPLVLLTLPAGVIAAVVFNGYLEIFQHISYLSSSTVDNDTNDNRVDSTMVADARSVLLLSWDDRT